MIPHTLRCTCCKFEQSCRDIYEQTLEIMRLDPFDNTIIFTPEERAVNGFGTKKKPSNDRKKKRNLIIKCCGKNKSCLNFKKSNNETRVIEETEKKISTYSYLSRKGPNSQKRCPGNNKSWLVRRTLS
jgi:hypothetical protein